MAIPQYLIKIALTTWLIIVVSSADISAKTIRFAPLPMFSKSTITKQFSPFVEYLSKNMGQQVELTYHRNYQDLLSKFIQDDIDLAYLGPLPYVMLIENDPDFVPVVRFVNASGESTYTCSLVTFDRDRSARLSLSKLPVALTQPFSTCGYLMTEGLLNRRGLSLNNTPYYYSGEHSECALDVIRGKASVAGIKTSIGKRYKNLGLQFVEQSVLLPGFLLVANPRTLSADTIDRIRKSLLSLDPLNSPADAEVTKPWGAGIRYGAVSAHETDYQLIKEKLQKIKIPEANP